MQKQLHEDAPCASTVGCTGKLHATDMGHSIVWRCNGCASAFAEERPAPEPTPLAESATDVTAPVPKKTKLK